MNPVQQYVDNKTGQRYYYTSNDLFCEACSIKLDFVVLHLCWGKKKSFAKRLCFNCSKKTQQETEAEEKIILLVVNKKPKNSKLVLIKQPELFFSSKDDSVFCNNLESTYINNQAKRSGHEAYTVLDDSAPVQIGLSVDKEVEAEKDKLIELYTELDLLLEEFKNDTLLIDENEKKKLGDGCDNE